MMTLSRFERVTLLLLVILTIFGTRPASAKSSTQVVVVDRMSLDDASTLAVLCLPRQQALAIALVTRTARWACVFLPSGWLRLVHLVQISRAQVADVPLTPLPSDLKERVFPVGIENSTIPVNPHDRVKVEAIATRDPELGDLRAYLRLGIGRLRVLLPESRIPALLAMVEHGSAYLQGDYRPPSFGGLSGPIGSFRSEDGWAEAPRPTEGLVSTTSDEIHGGYSVRLTGHVDAGQAYDVTVNGVRQARVYVYSTAGRYCILTVYAHSIDALHRGDVLRFHATCTVSQ